MRDTFRNLYFLSLFLILLPTMYLIPFVPSTHSLAVLIWGFLFIYLIVKKNALSELVNKNRSLLTVFMIFFIAQSLSVITATDYQSFVSAYEKVISIGIFLFLSLYFIASKNELELFIKLLFTVTGINLLTELFIFLSPNLFLTLVQRFYNKDYLDLVNINIQRYRIYIEAYDEILIPLILYYWIRNENKKIMLPFAVGIAVFSFLSLIRTKVVMFVLSVIASTLIFFKEIKRVVIFIFLTLGVFTLMYLFLFNFDPYTVVDRFLLTYGTDQATISSRIERWQISFEMALSSPFFGVGLGNYYDYLPSNLQQSVSSDSLAKQEFNIAALDPHDIFSSVIAETGGVGITAFLIMLGYFVKEDAGTMFKKKNMFSGVFIISFWTLFVYALFNPSTSISYQSLFWVLRAVIYKLPLLGKHL